MIKIRRSLIMARKKRIESPTGTYHWIARGINKKAIFHAIQDFRFFKGLVLEYKQYVDIHHYCFMTNHVHMLLRADAASLIGSFSQAVLRKYAYYYCKTYRWPGSVFQKGYKSIPVDKESYLLECGRYIERNPLKAFLVKTIEEYPHTSFAYYKHGQNDPLLTPSPGFLGLDPIEEIRRKIYATYVEEDRLQEKEMLRIK